MNEHDITGIALRELYPPLTGRGWLGKSKLVKGPVNVLDGDVFGIELEIDDTSRGRVAERLSRIPVPDGIPPTNEWLYSVVEEPSLAAGAEVVLTPLTLKELSDVIPIILKNLPAYDINDRCSTHVHMNALNLSWREFRALVSLYSILERFMFKWVASARETNVFTMPLYAQRISAQVGRWARSPILLNSRYLAFNVQGLVHAGAAKQVGGMDPGGHRHPQGTIEFRHMHGTPPDGAERLYRWVQILQALKDAARTLALDANYEEQILSLNSSSAYARIIEDISPVLAEELFSGIKPLEIQTMMEDAVSNLKYERALYEKKNISLPANWDQSPYMLWFKKHKPAEADVEEAPKVMFDPERFAEQQINRVRVAMPDAPPVIRRPAQPRNPRG